MQKINPITRGIWLAFVIGSAAASTHLLAAEQPASSTKTSAESDAAPTLKTVTVTAQRKEETLQETPVTVSAVSGENITQDGVRAMGDITTFVPNAAAKNPDGDGRPRWYIRGLGTGDTGASTVYPVGIYTDDVYQNSPVGGGGPLFDLERIEILRGPQGTLYGKNTTAGAVNVISKKPTFDKEPDGYATLGVGTKSERIVNGAIGGSLVDDKLAGRVSIYSEERDGFTRNETANQSYGDVNKKAVRVQFLAQLTPDLEALWKIHGRQFKGDGSSGSLPVGKYYPPANYERPDGRKIELNVNEDYKLDHDGTALTLNYHLGDYTLTSITAYDYLRNQSLVDADYNPYEVNGRTDTDNKYNQYSQEFRLASPQQETLRWLLGTHYFHETLDSSAVRRVLPGLNANGGTNQGATTTVYRDLDYTHKNDSFALFGNITYDFTDDFTVTGGLRWTTEEKDIDLSLTQLRNAGGVLVPVAGAINNGSVEENKTWNAWTYDVTPEYRLNDNARVYFRYAHGFRSGGYNTGLSAGLNGFTTVDPEELDAYELGLKTEWLNGRVTANATTFYYDYSDIQTNVLRVDNGVLTSVLTNGAQGEVWGAELEVEAQATDFLHLRAALSHLHTEFTDFKDDSGDYSGNRFVRSPEQVISLGADYTFPLGGAGKLVAGADASYRGKEYFVATRETSVDKTLSQDHYTLANARLTWSNHDDKLSVTGFVNNLTDRKYQVHGRPNGTAGQYVITYGDPRTVGVSVTTRF